VQVPYGVRPLAAAFPGTGQFTYPIRSTEVSFAALCCVEFDSPFSTEALCRSAVQLDKLKKSSRKRPHSIWHHYLWEAILRIRADDALFTQRIEHPLLVSPVDEVVVNYERLFRRER